MTWTWPRALARRLDALKAELPPAGTAIYVHQAPGKIANVELLGYKGKLEWSQTETGLSVTMPRQQPSQHAVTLKIVTG